MTSEVVTVRMSRGDLGTPWGFNIQHPAIVNNIIGSSLADRAGLQNGDVIEEIQGYRNPDFASANHALDSSKHSIEIIVIRNAGTPRLWKPQLSENAEMNRFQHSVHNMGPPTTNPPPPPPPTVTHPIKVSLEHRKEEVPIRGFNTSAKPFGSTEIQTSNQQQYNSPLNLYSAQNAAEQYLQQTGGLFGTDPNLAKQKEEPAYLRSETLRLIRENEQNTRGERLTTPAAPTRYSPRINDLDPLRGQPNPQGLPQCYLCGRNILGVMCRAFNHDLHADCFTCATCGSSLKNQGHHFVNDKFYCDIHGRQLKGRGPSMDPEKAALTPPTVAHPVKTPEPVKAFYQPDVMTRQPISLKSVSPTPWSTMSPISPSKRGVPPAQTSYGQQYRQTTTTNQCEISPNHLTPNNNLGVESTRRSPLPPDIRRVTSPRLPRSPKVVNWPPKQAIVEKSNRFWHISPETKVADKWLSLQEIVRMEDNKDRRPPSPKRYLLRGESKKPATQPPPSAQVKAAAPELSGNHLLTSMYDNVSASGSNFFETSTIHHRQQSSESIPIRWANVSEIVEEKDIMTENSSIRRSDDESSASIKRLTGAKRSDDESTVDQLETDSEDEQERWMREEVEQARKEREMAEQMEQQRLRELATDGTDDGDLDTDFDRDTEMSEIFDTHEEHTRSPYDELEETLLSCGSVLGPSDAKESICEDSFILNKVTKVEHKPGAISPLISEADKRMAIESIERHQRTLQDQQDQLSELLDDAILFLKGLDSDFSSKYLETPLIANHLREKQEHQISETVDKNETKPSSYDSASSRIVRALSLHQEEEDTGNNNYARTETHQSYEHQHQQQTNNNHYNEHLDGGRGKGQLMSNVNRIPYCEHCKQQIRGAFVLATGLTWCPEHFTCANASCNRKLLDVGFVEENGKKYCEQCFERLIAPQCSKCRKPITADCLNALQKQWHPHCFVCAHCHKPFGNSAFYLEQGQPYCEEDWNALFTTKCVSCKYPIEAGDRWVEALGSAFHSNCFNCTACQINLEGESFYAKNGAPYCKAHA
ncbi:hypothetical protein QR680_003317 [Steinernema hermaphroditum]|uniref:PDZ and LIM domain protein Zasp n=1 Tax=Steinernema hermaphroditum TaxID=289476 RepID=A0AA39H6A1_9BILA|nr:hypothetical protein QR680_003317 [Steinernema hermaphroditum]